MELPVTLVSRAFGAHHSPVMLSCHFRDFHGWQHAKPKMEGVLGRVRNPQSHDVTRWGVVTVIS